MKNKMWDGIYKTSYDNLTIILKIALTAHFQLEIPIQCSNKVPKPKYSS